MAGLLITFGRGSAAAAAADTPITITPGAVGDRDNLLTVDGDRWPAAAADAMLPLEFDFQSIAAAPGTSHPQRRRRLITIGPVPSERYSVSPR